jgi:hypothetical protein
MSQLMWRLKSEQIYKNHEQLQKPSNQLKLFSLNMALICTSDGETADSFQNTDEKSGHLEDLERDDGKNTE